MGFLQRSEKVITNMLGKAIGIMNDEPIQTSSDDGVKSLQALSEIPNLLEMLGLPKIPILKVIRTNAYDVCFFPASIDQDYEKIMEDKKLHKKLCIHFDYNYEIDVQVKNIRYDGKAAFIIAFPLWEKKKVNYLDFYKEANLNEFVYCKTIDQRYYSQPFDKVTSMYIGGGSGSGKTVTAYNYLGQLSHRTDTEEVELYLIDMKNSDEDWAEVRSLLNPKHSAGTFDEAIELLSYVVERYKNNRPSKRRLILILEEYDYMMNKTVVIDKSTGDEQAPDKDQHKRIRGLIYTLFSKYRSFGMTAICLGQGANRGDIGTDQRNNLQTTVGMWVSTTDKSKNVMGIAGLELNRMPQGGEVKVITGGNRIVQGSVPYMSQSDLVGILKRSKVSNINI